MSDKYAELFLVESREHLSAVNDALLELERGAGTAEPVHALFRAVHTVKGMSAAMGYTAATAFAHELESLLDRLRSGAAALSPAVVDALFGVADALEDAVAAAIGGADGGADGGVDGAAALERLRQVMGVQPTDATDAVVRRSDPTPAFLRTVEPAPAVAVPRAGAADGRLVHVALQPSTPLPGVRALLVVQRLESLGRVLEVRPSLPELQALAACDGFTVRLDGDAPASAVERAVREAGDVAAVRVETPQASAAAPALASSTSAAGAPEGPSGARPARATARSVRVDLRRLDALLDAVGELVIARGRLADAAQPHADPTLHDAVAQLSRLVAGVQEEVLATRLAPVSQLFDRFPRLVRDAARALEKEVEFEVEGHAIELDRSLLDELGDPLVHLLRNAVDHGLESAAERRRAGKPEAGRLVLSASRDRDVVLVRVQDDGRGIDPARVRRTAREQGLLGEDEELSDEELVRLISRAGFSTAEQVTELSGRGVGIDAVQTRLRALGGAVDIRSQLGEGTTVTLRLPLTLAIVPTLLARVGDETYALPASHVRVTAELADASLTTVRGEPVVVLGDDVVPVLDLRALVGLPPAPADGRELVVLDGHERRLGLLVDEIAGQQDAVVKRFDPARGGLACFSGATILGNGMPALIVDVGRLTS